MTAGDMTKLALIYIRESLLEEGIRPLKDAKVKLVNVVHDECSLEVPEKEAEKYAKLQKSCMEKAVNLLITKVKIPVNQAILDYWDH